MKASETRLQPIIEGTKQYIVPLFQRSYSWTKKQWEILWNDIIELSETGDSRSHFIGSIVTMPTTSVPEGVAKYLLIDGQQRLTTIFIIFALLRDKAKQLGQNKLSEEIHNMLLVNQYQEGSDYYKTLTAYNSELSNDDFETKRNRLCNSHLEMNKYFKDKNTWKKEEIEKRSEHLAETALSIWPYFGDETEEQQNQQAVTGSTPKKLWILGQSFDVQTWRDVLEQTMNTIADLEPEKIEQIIQQFPRMIGRDKKRFRAVREMKNGAFIEVNLSAKSIQGFCSQALETVELTADDWNVETV